MGFKDILIFKQEHEDKAHRVVDKFLEDSLGFNYEGIICICGISGTGKSEVAWWVNRMLYKLGISSHVVNLDRFYKIPVYAREGHRKATNVIGPKEMDWDKINEEIDRYSKNNIKVLIFEGLYAGYIGGTTFCLETTPEKAEDFRKQRGKEDEYLSWRKHVVAKECDAVNKNRGNYQFIIGDAE